MVFMDIQKENEILRSIIRDLIEDNSDRPSILDDDESNVYDYSGGNLDDAYGIGIEVGSYQIVEHIQDQLKLHGIVLDEQV